MVKRGAVTLHEFDGVLGASCRMSWRKLGPYILQERARSGNPSYGEWFEWLARELGSGTPGAMRIDVQIEARQEDPLQQAA